MSNGNPVSARRAMASACCAILATGWLSWSACAAEVASLDEIKARLRQQRDKIQSLYLETKEENTSPLSLEEYRKLPFRESTYVAPEREVHFGFKGEKRYLRMQEGEMPDLRPLPKLRPNATALEKKQHEELVQQQARRIQAADGGASARLLRSDKMTGYNGKVLWSRRDFEVKHPDGKVQKVPPQVHTLPPNNMVSLLIQPPAYLSHVGLAVLGPDFATQNRTTQDLLRQGLLPDVFDLGKYSVDGVEEIDGSKCLVVSGAHEVKVPAILFSGVYTIRQKLRLDLDRGLAMRKRECAVPQRNSRETVLLSNLEEVAPGFWLAKSCESRELAPPDDPDFPEQVRGKPIRITRITVTNFIVNQVPDDLFDVLVRPGDDVLDTRGMLTPQNR